MQIINRIFTQHTQINAHNFSIIARSLDSCNGVNKLKTNIQVSKHQSDICTYGENEFLSQLNQRPVKPWLVGKLYCIY